MRSLMMFASVVLVGTGTFCIANASVAFTSVAFVVGVAILVLGIIELLTNRAIDRRDTESTEINTEGYTATVLGLVILSGQLTEEVAVISIFALWLMMNGLKTFSNIRKHIRTNSLNQNLTLAVSGGMVLLGTYMLFNTALFSFRAIGLVGAAIILMGINRFQMGMSIEYTKPDFLSGKQERLAEAKRDEKIAMRKAKQAIRETNDARDRISKLTKEIVKERGNTRD